MALHLNLFHEVQRNEALRRRDPLKLSMYAMAAVALCFAGYYFIQVGKHSSLASEKESIQAEHDLLAPKSILAQKRADEISAMLASSKGLVQRIEGRLHWAPVLETLVQTVPAEIQLTRLSGDSSGEEAKRCTLSIDGVAAGTEPRQVAEEFRRTVAEEFGERFKEASSTFRSLEDSPNTVKLEGKSVPTATFSINIQLEGPLGDKSAAGQAAQPAAVQAGA